MLIRKLFLISSLNLYICIHLFSVSTILQYLCLCIYFLNVFMKNNHALLNFHFSRLNKPIPFNLFIYDKSSISPSYTRSPPLLLFQSQRILLVCFIHRLLNRVLLCFKRAPTNSFLKQLCNACNISVENIPHNISQNCHLFPWMKFNRQFFHLGLFFHHIKLINSFCL